MPVLAARNGAGITKEKLQEVMEVMKAWESPGLDGFAAECLKRSGTTLTEWLVSSSNVCLSGVVSVEWRSEMFRCIKVKRSK